MTQCASLVRSCIACWVLSGCARAPTGSAPEASAVTVAAPASLATVAASSVVGEPRDAGDCRASPHCASQGFCAPMPSGVCGPSSDEDCRASEVCRDYGNCWRGSDRCVAKSAADCAHAAECLRNASESKTVTCAYDDAGACEAVDLPAARMCLAKGGRWGGLESGRGRSPGCNLPTHDNGKPCTDSKQCEGGCVQGSCYGFKGYRGCGLLENAKTICVD